MEEALIFRAPFKFRRYKIGMIFKAEESGQAKSDIVFLDSWVALNGAVKHDIWKDLNVATWFNKYLVQAWNKARLESELKAGFDLISQLHEEDFFEFFADLCLNVPLNEYAHALFGELDLEIDNWKCRYFSAIS